MTWVRLDVAFAQDDALDAGGLWARVTFVAALCLTKLHDWRVGTRRGFLPDRGFTVRRVLREWGCEDVPGAEDGVRAAVTHLTVTGVLVRDDAAEGHWIAQWERYQQDPGARYRKASERARRLGVTVTPRDSHHESVTARDAPDVTNGHARSLPTGRDGTGQETNDDERSPTARRRRSSPPATEPPEPAGAPPPPPSAPGARGVVGAPARSRDERPPATPISGADGRGPWQIAHPDVAARALEEMRSKLYGARPPVAVERPRAPEIPPDVLAERATIRLATSLAEARDAGDFDEGARDVVDALLAATDRDATWSRSATQLLRSIGVRVEKPVDAPNGTV